MLDELKKKSTKSKSDASGISPGDLHLGKRIRNRSREQACRY